MAYTSRALLLIVALVAVLAMGPVAPEAGNILFLALGAAAIPFMFPQAGRQFRRPVVWLGLLGLLLLTVSYVFGSASVEGLVGIVFFTPVFAVWPLLALADGRTEEHAPSLVAALALAGVAGAAALAVSEFTATGTTRAGGIVANPIHFADVALLAGTFAGAGGLFVQSRWRFFFLLGPLFALVAVVLSGTRGAVVAAAIMGVTALLAMTALRLVRLRTLILVLAALGILAAAALWLGAGRLSGIQRVLIDIAETFRAGVPTDNSTSIRLQMYLGGLRAFLDSPIFGQGPLEFVAIASGLADVPFDGAPHLHNDIADFAASAGILGILAYVLLMIAPIAEVLRAPKGPERPRVLVLAVTLVAGYVTMGLTNAMFGILTVTTYYAAICLVIGLLVDQVRTKTPI